MMGMTAAEKILARASNLDRVRPGDIVYPDPELVIVHDGYIASSKAQLDEIGITRLFDPERVMFVTDHAVIYTTPFQVERGAATRKAAAAWGPKYFFDVGQGGHGHLVPIEKGLALPGSFIFANDMHCTNNGAVGALAMRTGTEIICVLATGTMWVEVPPTIRITLTGRMQPGVLPRDLCYKLARNFTNGAFDAPWDYRVIEFTGPAVEEMTVAERVPLCNTLTEIGVANVLFPPTEGIIAEARRVAARDFTPVYSDPDAVFEAEFSLDISTLPPQLVLPGSPDNAVDIDGHTGRAIDHAFLGSCGSGMYEDMAAAAAALDGKKVASGTRFFVTPGTEEVARRMMREGLTQIFHDSGAILLPPGCGPCSGGNMAPLGAGEVSLSTAATNFKGRMGSAEAEMYLASPLTVAVSAVEGRITDPRNAHGRENGNG
jgi:3-isopropylmalate/(R)-2-methylmalate dehydratase large subunit